MRHVMWRNVRSRLPAHRQTAGHARQTNASPLKLLCSAADYPCRGLASPESLRHPFGFQGNLILTCPHISYFAPIRWVSHSYTSITCMIHEYWVSNAKVKFSHV